MRVDYQMTMREAHTESLSMPPKEDDLIDRVGLLTSDRVKSLYLPLEMCPVISFVVDKAETRENLCKLSLDSGLSLTNAYGIIGKGIRRNAVLDEEPWYCLLHVNTSL